MASERETELAHQLITEVEKRLLLETLTLQRHVNAVLGYLDDVVAPNHHTVSHVRYYLLGHRDRELGLPPAEEIG